MLRAWGSVDVSKGGAGFAEQPVLLRALGGHRGLAGSPEAPTQAAHQG